MSSQNRIRHLSTYLNTSRNTILEMLKQRGYDVTEHMTFSPSLNNDKNMETIKIKKDNELIEVHYELTSTRTNHKILTKRVQEIILNFDEDDKSKDITIIFIVSDLMTPSVREAIKILMSKHKIFIQVFPIRTLMYVITNHNIVPKHIRIKQDEFKEWIDDFMDSLHINSLENLPKILDSDPVAMFIGLRQGELCKIIRPSISAGQHIVYRYCVQDNYTR